jgi:hypothetical protein
MVIKNKNNTEERYCVRTIVELFDANFLGDIYRSL